MSHKRLIAVLVFGFAGVAILLALGQWQLRRLAWKEATLAQIESRLAADPIRLPDTPEEERDEYRRVAVTGAYAAGEIHVLTSVKLIGPGFRVIAPFVTDGGRRIMIDRGFVPEAMKDAERETGPATVVGALLWPDETDGFTPAPDRERNFWFARDTVLMAETLQTEPVLVVAETGGEWPRPLPVTVNIPNDHLQYAITWFSLALIWAAMTGLLLWREVGRSRRPPAE